jgi:hypothetical protein
MAQSFRIYLPEKAEYGHAIFAGFLLRPREKFFSACLTNSIMKLIKTPEK